MDGELENARVLEKYKKIRKQCILLCTDIKFPGSSLDRSCICGQ